MILFDIDAAPHGAASSHVHSLPISSRHSQQFRACKLGRAGFYGRQALDNVQTADNITIAAILEVQVESVMDGYNVLMYVTL